MSPNTTDAQFVGTIPSLYENVLVPIMFVPYADDLAHRLAREVPPNASIVETAAGTGVVTRAVSKALPEARIIATDLNGAMLEVARQHPLPNVTWQQADAQRLPFEDGSMNAVICQFGMMFLPDKIAGYREARRVLESRAGCFIFSVWDRLEENELTRIIAEACARAMPNDPPRFLERTPFGHFDTAVLEQHAREAGFSRVAIEVVKKVATTTAEDGAVAICKATPLRNEIEARGGAEGLDEATVKATEALKARFGSGSFEHHMSALIVTARLTSS